MSSTIQWNPIDSYNVVCSSSDWQPSFFVNNDSLLNVKITGNLFIPSSTNDDDFVGFVFGYKSPTIGTGSNDNHFYLVDWKKVAQHAPTEFGGFMAYEGFNLSYANGIIPSDPVNTYRHFWGHESSDNFVVLDSYYGNNLGWEYNRTYDFTLIYTFNKIQFSIDDELIFDVSGCFPSGLFGLYSLNQNGARFSNIEVQQCYGFEIGQDNETICEERPVSFGFLDSTCLQMPSSLLDFEWSFGDGSQNSTELFPEHIFLDAGTYQIDLFVTNSEGCIDTISKVIEVNPKPIIKQQPVDVQCYVGDHALFEIEADYAKEYQWYFQSREMNYWSRLYNNGTFSGVQTSVLQVYNIRPNFDEMKFRCVVNGECNNLVTSAYGQILITDIPVRATLAVIDKELCTSDSTTLVINLKEPFLIKSANLRILYDTNTFEITNFSTYFQNIEFDVDIVSDYINVALNVLNPVNIDEAIITSIKMKSVGANSCSHQFVWDTLNTYFIEETGDTILQILNPDFIQVNEPYKPDIADSTVVCIGESVGIEDSFLESILWSNGSTGSSTLYLEEGNYWVSVIDTNTCASSKSFYFKPEVLPVAAESIVVDRDFYCAFHDTIQFRIVGGSGSQLHWSYFDKVLLDTLPNQVFQMANPGNSFTIITYWSNLCGTSDTIIKDVQVFRESFPKIKVEALADEIYKGDLVDFVITPSDQGENPHYVWILEDELLKMGADTAMSTMISKDNQQLKVILYSDARCVSGSTSAMDSLLIKLMPTHDYYIPTLVTPNNDGNNDSFKVELGDNEVVNFQLFIFDITGREVFKSNNYLDEWNGDNLPNQQGIKMFTYYLVYKLENQSEKTVSGKFIMNK